MPVILQKLLLFSYAASYALLHTFKYTVLTPFKTTGTGHTWLLSRCKPSIKYLFAYKRDITAKRVK